MGVDWTNPESLYKQVADDIRAKIQSGKLKIGDALSSHSQLVQEYQVSLITIKRALSELIKEGLVYSRVGKGTYVARSASGVNFARNQTIGFVLRDLNSPFFSRILLSVEHTATDNKYNLLLANSSNQPDLEQYQINHFLSLGVSGMIIASMSHQYTATPLVRHLIAIRCPYIVVSYVVDEDVYHVGTDHEMGGFIACEHLLKAGYRRIGYIDGEKGNLVGTLRRQGYLRAMREYDQTPLSGDIFRLRRRGEWFDYESGYEIGRDFVKLTTHPEAMFIYNDLAALGFQKALLESGLKVPDDVALVGFDDIKRGVIAPVPLTTIHQPTEEIGVLAVNSLIRMINNQPVPIRQILNPWLIVRDSCGVRRKATQPSVVSEEKSP